MEVTLMNALLSIKPEFVDEIRSGHKKFEFRKNIFKRRNVNKVLIYETSPVSKVVGEFTITGIFKEKPSEIWNLTRQFSGISKDFFDKYFEDKDFAIAIAFEEFHEYEEPMLLSDFGIKTAPQSYMYVD